MHFGFSLPPEWAPHAATWTCWPSGEELWSGYLSSARQEMADLIEAIASAEGVHLLVTDQEAAEDAAGRLGSGVTLHLVPLDDIWLRDSGPIFLRSGPDVSLICFQFNAWGEKFAYQNDAAVARWIAHWLGAPHFLSQLTLEGGSVEANGAGLAMTTRQCLLEPHRNPGCSQGQLESELRAALGVDLIWLEEGLEGDHTDGHIDTLARFVSERQVVCCRERRRSDPNCEVTAGNWQVLSRFQDAQGGLEITELPLPQRRLEQDGARLAASYANYYLAGDLILIPQYGDPNDSLALDILAGLFPDRRAIGLSARALITGGGAFHCVTQQQPAGRLWSMRG